MISSKVNIPGRTSGNGMLGVKIGESGYQSAAIDKLVYSVATRAGPLGRKLNNQK